MDFLSDQEKKWETVSSYFSSVKKYFVKPLWLTSKYESKFTPLIFYPLIVIVSLVCLRRQ